MPRPNPSKHLLSLLLCLALTFPSLAQATETLPMYTALFLDFHIAHGEMVLLGDVNGDGYSDVGIRHDNVGLVYFGSANGLDADNHLTLEPQVTGETFAVAMSSAGDVNGDGYDDIAVGANDNSYINGGRVYIFLGGSNGPSVNHDDYAFGTDVDQAFGQRITNAGDLNGDGFDDLVIDGGVDHDWQIWLGNSTGLAGSTALEFSHSEMDCFPAGDIDADGHDDVFFSHGYPYQPTIYFGSSSSVNPTPYTYSDDTVWHCSAFHPAGDVDGDGFADLIAGFRGFVSGGQQWGAAYLLSGRSYGAAPITWMVQGTQTATYPFTDQIAYGELVASAGDFNGDGFADLTLSDPEYDVGSELSHGLVEVFLGGPDGPADTADYRVVGTQANMRVGIDLVSGGDINGDGYGDILYSQHSDNHINIIYGQGQSVATSWAAAGSGTHNGDHLGGSVSAAGDLNADGFGDVAAGAYQYDNQRGQVTVLMGGESPYSGWSKIELQGESQGDRFGYSVAYAGDVNNDGYSDLVVGAPDAGGGPGRVYIYRGTSSGVSTTAAWILEADPEDDDFGFSVAGAGDANGDGYADVLVGDPYYDGESYNQGCAALFLGSADGLLPAPAWFWTGGEAQSHAGYAVSFAGDNNADGYTDLLVGSPGYDGPGGLVSRGRTMGFQGGVSGPDTYPDWSLYGTFQGGQLGLSVACAGDVNRDGYSDVLVGAPFQDYGFDNTGSAYLFLGSASGLVGSFTQRIDGTSSMAPYLGNDLDGIGDVNGDGYGDVAISEHGLSRVRVYLGSESGLDLDSELLISDPDFPQQGVALAGAGDVNGDGFSDLITGTPLYTGEFYSECGAYAVYLGNGKSDVGDALPFRARQAMINVPGVDLRGKLHSSSTGAPISMVGYSAAGRCDVRFQHRAGNTSLPLDMVSTNSEQWNETISSGDHGQYMNLQVTLPPVPNNSLQHWQSRMATDNIYLPHSRWYSPAGAGVNLMHFRGAVDAPLANLVVSDLGPDSFSGGGDIVLTFDVTNNGQFPAVSSYCSVTVDGVVVTTEVATGPLVAGQAVSLTANIGPQAVGMHTVLVAADVDGVVPESNESDNQSTLQLDVNSQEHLLVRPDGSGDVPTIADAVALISHGGVIELADGVFSGPGNRDVAISSIACTLRSVSGNTADCVIDAQGSSAEPHRGLNLSSLGSGDLVVQNITIRNGYNNYGGGVFMSGASPHLENCVFQDCGGQAGGAVFAISGSGPVFYECRFSDNSTTDSGGGLGLNGSSAQLQGCVFERNFATYGGGAVYQYNSNALFESCVFDHNSSNSMGGAIHGSQAGSTIDVNNCTFYANAAPNGGHLYTRYGAPLNMVGNILAESTQGEAFYLNGGGPVYASCNDVFGNVGGDYVSGLDGMLDVYGNYSVPPLFCDANGGNFHLQSESECIGHGSCGTSGALGVGCGFEYVVNPDGSGDFPTIQAAVDAAGFGDIIKLGNGTFLGNGNRDVVIAKPGLTLRSQWGDSSTCVIDCQGAEYHEHQALVLTSAASQTTLERFTVTGGFSTTLSGCGLNLAGVSPVVRGIVFRGNHAVNGGAIFCGSNSNPEVTGCVFEGNTADNAGGAISLNASGGSYEYCTFRDNGGYWGGGAMYLHTSTPDVDHCLFTGNHSDHWGGAIHGNQPATLASFSSCTFDGNSAETGGCFYLRENCVINLSASILTNSSQGEAVYVKTGGQLDASCGCLDVFGNAGGDYVGGLADFAGLPGFLAVDPQYCDAGSGVYSLSDGSPCLAVNSGCPLDMGAFGSGCSITAAPDETVPDAFTLRANYPNPFNPQTVISYGLPADEKVTLVIYDLSGQVVRRLLDRQAQAAGFHQVSWNGQDDGGRAVASGVYFYRVQAGEQGRTSKMTLVR